LDRKLYYEMLIQFVFFIFLVAGKDVRVPRHRSVRESAGNIPRSRCPQLDAVSVSIFRRLVDGRLIDRLVTLLN
jgi:hypothetical protein